MSHTKRKIRLSKKTRHNKLMKLRKIKKQEV